MNESSSQFHWPSSIFPLFWHNLLIKTTSHTFSLSLFVKRCECVGVCMNVRLPSETRTQTRQQRRSCFRRPRSQTLIFPHLVTATCDCLRRLQIKALLGLCTATEIKIWDYFFATSSLITADIPPHSHLCTYTNATAFDHGVFSTLGVRMGLL